MVSDYLARSRLRVGTRGNHPDSQPIKCFDYFLDSGQLARAVRSPDSAIEHDVRPRVTQITGLGFLLAVGPAAIVRAACYSFLGANLLDPGSPRLWIASGILVAVALLPLAHPGLRARLFRVAGNPRSLGETRGIDQSD